MNSNKKIYIALVSATMLLAMNTNANESFYFPSPDGTTNTESQCGNTLDFQHVEQYDGTQGVPIPFAAENERPVGRLLINNTNGSVGACSGTLISPNLFLTAEHCLSDNSTYSINFNFQNDPSGNPRNFVTFNNVTSIEDGSSSGLDYAILRVGNEPGSTFGWQDISLESLTVNDRVAIIQHPQGMRKVIDAGTLVGLQGSAIRYNELDTLGGSSGSGVLNAQGSLIGVHTNGGCSATNINSSNSGVSIQNIVNVSTTLKSLAMKTVGSADFNGDGFNDILIQIDSGGTRFWQVGISNGRNEFDFGQRSWSATGTADVDVVALEDVNADGRADLVLQYESGGQRRWQARLSNGSSFRFNGNWTQTGTANVDVVAVKDVNGDDRADLVLQYESGGQRRWQARLSNGTSFGYSGDWTQTGTANVDVVALEDVNADGMADLILQYESGGQRRWQARLSNGSSFRYNGDWTQTGTANVDVVAVKDVNGDDRADLVLQYESGGQRRWQARLSNGSSFRFNGDWTQTGTANVDVVAVKDVNGDNRADLILQYESGGQRHWQPRVSNGNDFFYNGDWVRLSSL